MAPVTGGGLGRLAGELARARPVALPDLPGVGLSPPTSAPASLEADAASLDEQVLPACERWDVVGDGRGGSVALALAERAPGRIRSLALLGAPGVEELALLGSHDLNRLAHGLVHASQRAHRAAAR